MDSYIWKEGKWENANEEDVGSCDRDKGEIHTEKRESVSVIERRERRGVWVHRETIEEEVY